MEKKSQNKGFSLVELIVVVLIMGIIAVALAPQVTKWIWKTRESADFQAKDELKATAQVAMAEYESSASAVVLQSENYNVTSSGIVASDGTDDNAGMISLLESYLNGTYPKVQSQNGKVFQIQMQSTGSKIIVDIVSGTY